MASDSSDGIQSHNHLLDALEELQKVATQFYDTIERMRAALHLPPLSEVNNTGADAENIPF